MSGNIKLIYVPADRDCLSHTMIKSHQMTKKQNHMVMNYKKISLNGSF